MKKQQFDDRSHIAGTLLLLTSMGVQMQEPKQGVCKLCNKYPKTVYREHSMCMACCDKVGKALRALFGFVTQQEKTNV